ncbi:MAG: hypothetical protein PWQ18_320 [Clostridia bacterium]|nr:hypothetical protein [Clostridia bacterium]
MRRGNNWYGDYFQDVHDDKGGHLPGSGGYILFRIGHDDHRCSSLILYTFEPLLSKMPIKGKNLLDPQLTHHRKANGIYET